MMEDDDFNFISDELVLYDEFLFKTNEFESFQNYLIQEGIETENDLCFNGDKELAKNFEKKDDNIQDNDNTDNHFSSLNIVNSYFETIVDDDDTQLVSSSLSNTIDENLLEKSPNIEINITDISNSTTNGPDLQINTSVTMPNVQFLIPLNPYFRHVKKKLSMTTFQKPNEPRIKYLLRFPKLHEEYFNSANFERLEILYNDVFAENFLFLIESAPPIVGHKNFFQFLKESIKAFPDFCVFHNQIERKKRHLITTKGNSFGTLPHQFTAASPWNIYESVSIENMSEHDKLQKKIYDELRKQNKTIRFERQATWHFVLSRDLKKVDKFMSSNTKNHLYG